MRADATSPHAPEPIPAPFRALVDDAAIFPPGNAPLPDAVLAHRGYRSARYAGLVGPFVVSDIRLPDLVKDLTAADDADHAGTESAEPLAVSVVVSGGAGAVEPAVRWAGGSEALQLRAVEIALRDEQDLAHNARRVVTVVDQLRIAGLLDDEVPVYVETPRMPEGPSGTWFAALDELAAMDLRLKFRTGGVTEDAFPSPAELAAYLTASLDRELAFKCTAGLHRAVRHFDDETGAVHHGFLNVLLATRASLDGATADEVEAVLSERDLDRLRARLADAGADGLVSARRWFTSFGSCSVLEPLEDLIDLDLLPDLPLETV